MIDRLVSWCLGNRPIVLAATVLLTIVGIDAVYKTPIDAIPDLSENQVIVLSDWAGRSAQEVEDQVTFPLSTALQGLAGVREVRAQSAFGFSMLTVIFRDDIDVYFARTRVLEKLSALPFRLPDGVTPKLGPDATASGGSTNTIWMIRPRLSLAKGSIWVNFVPSKIGLSDYSSVQSRVWPRSRASVVSFASIRSM